MRARLLVATLAGLPLLGLLIADPTRGQVGPTAPAREVLPFGPALLLPTESSLPKKLQAARDFITARDWEAAAKVLQDLLAWPEDVFLPFTRRGPDDQEITVAVSLRAETEGLIARLPRPGLEVYELLAGKHAARDLAEARGEPAALAAVVQRYPHTRAAAEAAARLGAYHLDRGHFDLAAAYFDRVLRSPGAGRPQPLTLFQAALAFRRAGDRDRSDQAWRRLADTADGISAGSRTIPLDDLEKELNRPVPAAASPPEANWCPEPPPEGTAGLWVADALRRLQAASQPVLPLAAPLVVGHTAVVRTFRGVRAVDLRSGATVWEAPSALSLDSLARDPAAQGHVAAWVESYLASHPHVLLENSVLGSLTSDGRRVYAVEDLPVPPRPNNYYSFHSNHGEGLVLADAPGLTGAVTRSRLLALDAVTGKVLWDAGAGQREGYFLGPPLPLGGKLYAPVQKGFDLRLLCLEPLTGAVLWSQTLATYKARLAVDGGRRLHAVRPAFADGLLVVPTHAGGVVAFDLVGRRFAWTHAYRDEPPPPIDPMPSWGRGRGRRPRANFVTEPPNLAPEWKLSAPIIAGGKVVLAAADSPALCCLDLHDGSLVWETKRAEGDLFAAGIAGDKVLVVSKAEVRALGLVDGKPVWQCATGVPGDRGTLAAGAYHLPIRGPEGKPEVLTIDLARGAVVARSAPLEKVVAEALPLPDSVAATAAPIAALVAGLGGDNYADREAAALALEAAGVAAIDPLRAAAGNPDPELSRRAAGLIRAIEKRAESARLLAPPRLHLQYQDRPLAEATLDFARKCGVVLRLPPELAKSGERKVTLDTGEVTFWDAFDRFCAAAGLVEVPPVAPAPDPRGGSVTVSSMVIVGGVGGRASTDVMRTTPDDRPLELMLADGRPAPTPASAGGAVRVRAVPPDVALPHLKKDDGEALVALDVALAGPVQWQKVVGVRLDRALDDEGRSLAAVFTPFNRPPPTTIVSGRGGLMINGMPVVTPPEETDSAAARVTPLRLKQPAEKPAKMLKELTGTITAQVRTPREALVTIDNVLQSAGRLVKGRHGGEVHVVEAVKTEDGQVRIKVRVEAVGRALSDVPQNPFGGTLIVNGKRLGDENLLSSLDFSLLDVTGKPFRTVTAVHTGVRAGAAPEYELVYEAEAGQGEAAKFVYADRRTLFIDVPFTLQDVPLP
jgi:outer membrane protein assembly factor BamB